MKIAIIISTAGSVFFKLLGSDCFKQHEFMLFSDRNCPAIRYASKIGVGNRIIPSKNGAEFSEKLLKANIADEYDLLVSFYTKLFSKDFVIACHGKLINLHPSILPACPGLNGFEDTLKSKSKYIGSTIHFISEGIDNGLPIIQSALPYNPTMSVAENRHEIFIDQCRTLLQVVKWFNDGRINVTEQGVIIESATYKPGRYAPNLDYDEAINLTVNFLV